MAKKSKKKADAAVNHNETKSAIAKRQALKQHPLVVAELDRIWTAANFNDEDAVLDRQEYYTMHRKVRCCVACACLEPLNACRHRADGHGDLARPAAEGGVRQRV